MTHYVAVGHVAQDVTPQGLQLGGTVAYATLTAQALGLTVSIVTAAAPAAPLNELLPARVHCRRSAHSTVFENRYTDSGRQQILHSRADLLTAASVPAGLAQADIAHLAPIANELTPGILRAFPRSFIGVTPQGWMRRWDEGGRVFRAEWENAAPILRRADAVVLSLEDVAGDRALVEGWAGQTATLALTQAERGATVFWKGERRHFEARRVDVADATGAGDIFAASFFIALHRWANAWRAARFAVEAATDSVTRVGMASVPPERFRSQLEAMIE